MAASTAPVGDGGKTLDALAAERGFGAGCIDFVFLDHDKNAYVSDLHSLLSRGLLRKGMIVVADNVKISRSAEIPCLHAPAARPRLADRRAQTHGEYGTVLPDLVLESVYLGGEPGGE